MTPIEYSVVRRAFRLGARINELQTFKHMLTVESKSTSCHFRKKKELERYIEEISDKIALFKFEFDEFDLICELLDAQTDRKSGNVGQQIDTDL
jgi:hypothetical protein